MSAPSPRAALWICASPEGCRLDSLLGLPIVRRAVLAGKRAGFGTIYVEEGGRSGDLAAAIAETPAIVLRRGSPTPEIPPGRLVVLSATALPQPSWLRALASLPVEPGRLLADGSMAAALDAAADDAVAASLLARPVGAGPVEALRLLRPVSEASPPPPSGRLEVASAGDLPAAERWLLAGLVKEHEGFMSRHVERRISLAVSRRLAATRITPNAMTLISVAIGVVAAAFFLSTRPAMEFAGALLFLLHSILDGCDGELARLKFAESRFGGVLDFWGDNVVHSAVFTAIAIGWHRATGETWPVAAGIAAVGGTLASAAFVYRTTMANSAREGPAFVHATVGPSSALSRVADALAQRDFIYLVVLLSAFGKAHWFLTAAAIGAPLFLAVLVALAARHPGRSFS